MLSYNDMTYCTSTECPHFGLCPRTLTDAVVVKAEALEMGVAQFGFWKGDHCGLLDKARILRKVIESSET